jgi:hypothetical protein
MDKLNEIRHVRELSKNVPDGMIRDADTILKDIMDEASFEETGIAEEIFGIWEAADSENGRRIVEEMFLVFTGTEFEEYLKVCMKEITRK